jgi:hypothetical protein
VVLVQLKTGGVRDDSAAMQCDHEVQSCGANATPLPEGTSLSAPTVHPSQIRAPHCRGDGRRSVPYLRCLDPGGAPALARPAPLPPSAAPPPADSRTPAAAAGAVPGRAAAAAAQAPRDRPRCHRSRGAQRPLFHVVRRRAPCCHRHHRQDTAVHLPHPRPRGRASQVAPPTAPRPRPPQQPLLLLLLQPPALQQRPVNRWRPDVLLQLAWGRSGAVAG